MAPRSTRLLTTSRSALVVGLAVANVAFGLPSALEVLQDICPDAVSSTEESGAAACLSRFVKDSVYTGRQNCTAVAEMERCAAPAMAACRTEAKGRGHSVAKTDDAVLGYWITMSLSVRILGEQCEAPLSSHLKGRDCRKQETQVMKCLGNATRDNGSTSADSESVCTEGGKNKAATDCVLPHIRACHAISPAAALHGLRPLFAVTFECPADATFPRIDAAVMGSDLTPGGTNPMDRSNAGRIAMSLGAAMVSIAVAFAF